MKNDCYIYVIFDPDGMPCYVGKGRGRRWTFHKRHATNKRLQMLYKKYGDLPIIQIRSGLSQRQAYEVEIALIAAIGRSPDGPLFNQTSGGGSKFEVSEEVREKISRANFGRKRPESTGLKISAALKGRVFTPEWKEKLRKAKRPHLKGPISEKRREAIRVAVTAFWASRRAEAIAKGEKVMRLGWDQR